MPKRKEPDPSSSTGVVLEASSASDLNTKGSPANAKRQKTDQAPPQTKDSKVCLTLWTYVLLSNPVCIIIKKKSASVELPEASKRLAVPGKQRRLGTSATAGTSKVNRISGSTRRNVTLSGNKVNFGLGTGGFEGVEKDASPKEEELWVTRKAGFAFLLKRALGAFTHRGWVHTLQTIRPGLHAHSQQMFSLNIKSHGRSHPSCFDSGTSRTRPASMRFSGHRHPCRNRQHRLLR